MYSQEQGKTFGWYSKNFEGTVEPGKVPQEPAKASFSYKDFEQNGKYCNTGLAFLLQGNPDINDGKQRFQSVCAGIDKIMQGDKVL